MMLEYGVTQYKVVATSVLREAQNRAYVVDQVKIQNDMAIEVLEDDQEKTLIYSEILNGVGAGFQRGNRYRADGLYWHWFHWPSDL